ncbi:plastocyanin/azurin family copper-binding protein [Paucibacter soli]|uniref:plastocyanin/azurin family copper-binding protein n=1 Tax=Paucibacter soli TaxID=3133433 RepID=UPI0030AA0D28
MSGKQQQQARRRCLVQLASLGALPLLGPRGGMAAPAAEVVVDIRDYRFMPAELSVPVGTLVVWTNSEKRTTHSILFAEEGLESERLFPGERWQRRFERPGRYPYRCGPHPEMTGLVEVLA